MRQHLQQQRRISGRASPKPGALARSQKLNSPLQASFDLGQEGSYRYHFSKSSLSRAQKAKDYLELLAQHRRLLDLVPPLTANQTGRQSTASRPTTPNGSAQSSTHTDLGGPLGRPYNPLQYIRNRKVRARERQVIDSEAQGFNDVLRVTEWVDEAAKLIPSESSSLAWNGLPSFSTADEATPEASPPSNASRPALTGSKPKRPRVDWVIDPADMIADLYWLEQGDRKMLVEDRHWRRVFPQNPELYRPLSRHTDSSAPVTPQHKPASEPSTGTTQPEPTPEHKATKGEHDHVLSSARERAQQKLHALRSLHHRHSSSIHGPDFLRNRRGSLSDASATDDEWRQRSRSGTIASSGKDILEKQMMEMIAREQRDAELKHRRDALAAQRRPVRSDTMSPEEGASTSSTVFSGRPSHKREGSITEASETESKYRKLRQRPASPQRGRASLEVPHSGRRPSFDYDSSVPNSPDMRPTRSSPFVPAIGMDLTPASSRPSSPTRRPFSKVKRIFRDRSRERGADFVASPDPVVPGQEPTSERLSLEKTRRQSPHRDSRSPARKAASGGTGSSHKSHWSMNNNKHRVEEASPGIRGLLKGPRIDSVLRSGVSRVGEFIWRKESEGAEAHSSGVSSDDSELEPARGRPGKNGIPSLTQGRNGTSDKTSGKSYLSVMPSFAPSSDSHGAVGEQQDSLATPGPPSRPPSRSPRFERLKPPRIDVQTTPTKTTPPGPTNRFPYDADASDVESHRSSYAGGVRGADARLNAALRLPRQRQFSTATGASRCFSIPDRATSQVAAAPFSRAEIARLRALVLSSGVMAMEIDRRAKTRRLLGDPSRLDDADSESDGGPPGHPADFTWNSIANFAPDARTRADILSQPTAQTETYPLAARVLGASVQRVGENWRDAAESFAANTSPALRGKVEALRDRVRDQSEMTRAAADEADEVSRDLAVGQRLQIKRVVDVIEKMLRRRRRRFRWLRRAGWLALEWLLVGVMWYVWFVVMIARVFFGIGKGFVRGVRWLLWL